MDEQLLSEKPVSEVPVTKIREFRKAMLGMFVMVCFIACFFSRLLSFGWLLCIPALLLLGMAAGITLGLHGCNLQARWQWACLFGSQGISAFVMALCLLSGKPRNVAEAVTALALACGVALALLPIGYHHHYRAAHQKNEEKKIAWSKLDSVAAVLAGIGLAKCLSNSWLTALLWGLWVWVHLLLSAELLGLRKWQETQKRVR